MGNSEAESGFIPFGAEEKVEEALTEVDPLSAFLLDVAPMLVGGLLIGAFLSGALLTGCSSNQVGRAGEAVHGVLVPVKLHAYAAHRRDLAQAVELRPRVFAGHVREGHDGLRLPPGSVRGRRICAIDKNYRRPRP